jgi:toxin ParE1/3/4
MKSFKVVWAEEAQADFENLIQYLLARESAAAEKIFRDVLAQADSLSVAPERGRKVPELRTVGPANVREIFYKPWRLIYRIKDYEVRLLMIVDGRRNLDDVLVQNLVARGK